MGSLVTKMRLRCEQQFKCDIRWERRLSEELVRLIAVRVKNCTKRFRTSLNEAVLRESLGCPILEEVLGGMRANVDMRNILDSLFLQFCFY